MTGAEAVALLAGRLGRRTGLDSLIVLEMTAAQELKLEKAGFFPWFLEVDVSTLVTVANQEYIDLPADFLGFDEDLGGLFFDDATGASDPWIPVSRDSYINFKERFRNPTAAAVAAGTGPEVFDIVGSRLYMRPIPTSIIPLRMIYMQKQAAPVNDGTTNLWLTHAHDWLLGETGVMMAGFQTQNQELGSAFAAMVATGRQRVMTETTARLEAARMRSMGED